MPYQKEKKDLFEEARKQLRAALVLGGLTQEGLADLMGKNASNLSARLGRDSLAVYEEIAIAFPPAGWITAAIFRELTSLYQQTYDEFMDEKDDALRGSIDALRKASGRADKDGE